MKILIVDDMEENLYLLETLLKGIGYEVITAKDGAEALGKLKENPIDMIISDILMPRMDGFQLCRECKKDESLKKIPFIFYTATYTNKKDEDFALSLGAEKFLVKPQDPEVFLKILKEVIKESRKDTLVAPKEVIKEEEIYLTQYNKRLIQKLEKKMLDLEKSEKRRKYLYSVLGAIRGVNQLIVREKDRNVLLQKSCDTLTKVRGYNTAWLGFLKDEKTFAMVVGSPLGADVSRFCEQVMKGNHPPCIKKALTKKDPFLFIDRSRDCGECSLKKLHLGKNSLLIRIAHESKLLGFLALSLEPDVYMDQEEKELLEEVVGDIAFGLHNIELGENLDKRTHDLKKRVKELNCLWKISNLIERPDISPEAIIKGTVNLLLSAWQHPQITCARIILDSKEYKSKNFKETVWKQVSDIILHKKPIGTVEVYYLEERPQREEGPFLKEERNLINIVAARLGEIFEKKQAEEKLLKNQYYLTKAQEMGIIGTWELDIQKNILIWTDENYKIFGVPLGTEMSYELFLNCVHPDDRDYVNEKWSARLNHEPYDIEHRLIISNKVKWVREKADIEFDKESKPIVAIGFTQDITERKQAEEALVKSEEKYRSLFESSKDGIAFSDMEGNLHNANQAFLDILGYRMDEVRKLTYKKLLPKKWQNDIIRNQVIARGYSDEQEIELVKKDGIIFPITIRVWMINNEQGKPVGMWAIIRDITERKLAEGRLKKTMNATIDTMSNMIEAKDPYTSGHQHRVCQLAVHLARELGLSKDKVEGIRIASLIHDIGKIGLPTEILSKPTKLTDIEFSLIKDHTQIGHDILKSIEFSYPIAQIVLQHHERLNGSGYPNNLKGEDILLEARIIGVADVVEAMSSHRPYRPALGIDAALEEISKNKSILYDPEVVDTCIRLFKEKDFEFKL